MKGKRKRRSETSNEKEQRHRSRKKTKERKEEKRKSCHVFFLFRREMKTKNKKIENRETKLLISFEQVASKLIQKLTSKSDDPLAFHFQKLNCECEAIDKKSNEWKIVRQLLSF